MQTEKILICHRSNSAIVELRQYLLSTQAAPLVAHDITEAYNSIEHHSPNYLIIASDLAMAPDFEVLKPILRELNVRCIFWKLREASLFISNTNDARQIDDTFSFDQLPFVLGLVRPYRDPIARTHHNQITKEACETRRICMIGASTGGIDALAHVIKRFGRESPPVLIVQHTGGQFAKSLTRHLNGMTDARVVSAEDGMTIETGKIYLAPDDTHHLLLCGRNGDCVRLGSDGLVRGHRPSVDALFRSGVPFAKRITAALLTGMGQDGARGLQALRKAGAHTIVQDEATSVVYGMPRIAVNLGAAIEQLPITKIGTALLEKSAPKANA